MTIDRPTPDRYPAMKKLWQQAFGDSEAFVELFFRHGFSPERCRVAWDGELLAALYWFDCSCGGERIAYLYAVATEESHRGKGVCRALMEDTHRHLEAMGYSGSVLCPAGEGLFSYYGSMGYRTCSSIKSFPAKPSGEAVGLRQVEPEEYAALRRQYLPRGAVLQEGPLLRFLAAYAKLYAGDDFLLAAYRDGDKLYAMELLGNEACAPGILTALGCSLGVFRAPGGDTPFAMYRGRGTAPTYLGLDLS